MGILFGGRLCVCLCACALVQERILQMPRIVRGQPFFGPFDLLACPGQRLKYFSHLPNHRGLVECFDQLLG